MGEVRPEGGAVGVGGRVLLFEELLDLGLLVRQSFLIVLTDIKVLLVLVGLLGGGAGVGASSIPLRESAENRLADVPDRARPCM